jgi:hypothetical protein
MRREDEETGLENDATRETLGTRNGAFCPLRPHKFASHIWVRLHLPTRGYDTSAPELERNSLIRSEHASNSHTPTFLTIGMAPAVKKPAGQVVQAEVALHQSLKNCFVNLPSSLVSVLVNANAVWLCFAQGDKQLQLIAYRSHKMLWSSFSTVNRLQLDLRKPKPRLLNQYSWDGLACRASAGLRLWLLGKA